MGSSWLLLRLYRFYGWDSVSCMAGKVKAKALKLMMYSTLSTLGKDLEIQEKDLYTFTCCLYRSMKDNIFFKI